MRKHDDGAIRTETPLDGQLPRSPAVDATGLTGGWNVEITILPPSAQAAAGEGDTLFSALRKLGLELTRETAPAPVLIVERVNQKPSDNRPGVAERLAAGAAKFEVAAIRPFAGNAGRGGQAAAGASAQVQPSGQVMIRGTLRGFIALAWNTRPASVVGTQRFLDSEQFEIVATVPVDTPRPG